MYAVKTAVFKALFTALGAMKIPLKNELFKLKFAPRSFPIPGAVNLSATIWIKSAFPATYPPVEAIPPPKFFIKDPTTTSAPICPGSSFSTNSP